MSPKVGSASFVSLAGHRQRPRREGDGAHRCQPCVAFIGSPWSALEIRFCLFFIFGGGACLPQNPVRDFLTDALDGQRNTVSARTTNRIDDFTATRWPHKHFELHDVLRRA